MKKYITIVSLLSLLFSFESYADTNQGLEKFNNAVTQTDNVNSTLERASGVLDRFGSVFKKKKKENVENNSTNDNNSSNQQSTDDIKEKVKDSAKLQNEDSSSDKE